MMSRSAWENTITFMDADDAASLQDETKESM